MPPRSARRALVLTALALAVSGCSTPDATTAAATSSPPGMYALVGDPLLRGVRQQPLVVRAGEEAGFFVTVEAHPGRGVVDGAFRELSSALLADRGWPDPYYDLLLIQAGESDADDAPARVATGTAQLLDRVRLRVNENTRVVLIGPFGDAADPALRSVRSQMRAVAREKGVPFLDPLLLGWEADRTFVEQLPRALARLGMSAGELS